MKKNKFVFYHKLSIIIIFKIRIMEKNMNKGSETLKLK